MELNRDIAQQIEKIWLTKDEGVRAKLLAKYKDLVNKAVLEAKKYTGTEKTADSLLAILQPLEKMLQKTFRASIKERLTDGEEQKMRQVLDEANGRTINEILDLAVESFRKGIDSIVATEALQVHLPGVLLPPGKGRIETVGKGQTIEPVREQERLKELIIFLTQHQVYVDDLVICKGQLPRNMMREHSYVLVEIPRLNRSVLVCDEVGEATFVIHGIFNRERLLRLSKEELQLTYPDHVIKVVYQESKQWQSALEKALFAGSSANANSEKGSKKVDVREREEVQIAVKDRHPNAESWMKLFAKIGDIVPGFAITKLGTIFGIAGNLQGQKKPFVALGRAIYGDDEAALQKEWQDILFQERLASEKPEEASAAQEELRTRIKAIYPNGNAWLQLYKKRGDIVSGFAMTKLGTTFDIVGNAKSHKKPFVALGIAIYGEDDPTLQAEWQHLIFLEKLVSKKPEEVSHARDELRAKVKALYPNGEAWMKLFAKSGDIIPGLAIKRLASSFNLVGDVDVQKKPFVALGIAIYGEDDPTLQAEWQHLIFLEKLVSKKPEEVSVAQEQLRTKVQAIYPNGEAWMKLFAKTGEIIPGFAVTKLATSFNVVGKAQAHKKVFVALGVAIYGSDDPALH